MDKYLNFYNNYTKNFDFNSKGIKVKYEHSLKVYENSLDFIKNNNFSENDNELIKFIALFHDIGRFEQYEKYNTFNDNISIDHGKLGCDILLDNNILNDFNDEEIIIILKSIYNHNKLNIDNNLTERQLLHTKIIRDLDKLDIYRVYLEYYKNKPDKLRTDYYNLLINGNKIDYNTAKNSVDYAILKLSWIYDINFNYTLIKIKENNYIDKLFESVLDDPLKINLKNKLIKDLNEFIV
jgi:putative nucleotidyltransferase with HDIG domain